MSCQFNFSAGPSLLPKDVMLRAQLEMINWNNTGMSVMEMSHRGKEYTPIILNAEKNIRALLNIPLNYRVLFLQGGASTQFLMSAYNLLETKASYLNTGSWSDKAIKEAKLFGSVNELASSKSSNFNYIPKDYVIPTDSDYFHCTSNNTIYGTQMKEFKSCPVPLICDMSSDIFSRVLDFSKFDLIYAGAQKNMGPAGTTIVIVKEDVLGKVTRQIPSMMNYQLMIDKDSMFNTPPVFSIYVSLLTMKWLKNLGGVETIDEINKTKAIVMYSEIDLNPLFKGFAAVEDRSTMNATFSLVNEGLKDTFESMVKEAGIEGINGHRSVGGYRASMYNALSLDSVKVLVEVMSELETKA